MDVMPVRLDNSAGIDGLNRRSGIPGDSDKKDDGLTHLLASDQALKISDDKNIPHQISPKDEDHVQPAERESSGPAAGDTTVDIAVEYVQKEVAKINDVAVDQKIVNGGLKGHVESPGSRHYKILVRLLPWVPRTLLLTILSHVPGADGRPTQNSFTYETLDFSSSSAALVSLALGLFLATAFGQVSKCSIDKALGLGRSGVRVGIMAAALPIILGGLASFALDDPENISKYVSDFLLNLQFLIEMQYPLLYRRDLLHGLGEHLVPAVCRPYIHAERYSDR